MSDNKHYCVIGGGLVGSLLSVILAQRGMRVAVYERRPDLREVELQGGRSINLALSERGLRALRLIGLEDEVRKLCIPMFGRMVHTEDGQMRFMQYGKDGEAINSVSRGGLNRMLIRKADESPKVELHFDQRVEHIDYNTGNLHLRDAWTGDYSDQKYDVFFGTDGAFSAARTALMRTDKLDFEFKQDYLEHGYKELSIPPAEGGGWQIEKNALHIWPRKSFMMIALPNLDGSFTVTLFLPLEGEVSFDKLKTEKDVKAFFDKYFPTAVPLMPTLMEDFFENPTSSLVTIRCSPWHYKDKALLLGDAAHAIVPFYGQGMNAGFEDCSVLNRLIDEHGTSDWETVFAKFDEMRKPNGDAVADLALMNFIEMRDLVADPKFILKNQIDKKMEQLFPDRWTTLYRMVTFSELNYADAMRLGREHSEVLDRIVAEQPGIEARLGDDEIKAVLEGYLV